MKRTLVVGDIHGGLKALKQVINRVQLSPQDTLYFLGDYADGWPDTAPLIDYLIALNSTYNCHFIYGNHDAWCFDWLITEKKDPIWLKHGGKSTLISYSDYSAEQKKKHIDFFKEMKNYSIDAENRLFIHAGYSSMHGPEKEFYTSNYQWDRTLWETAIAAADLDKTNPNYPQRLTLFTEIFIGHTPTTQWNIHTPWKRSNVWNMDTGAAFKGKLSVMDIETNQFWQSDPVMELYPNHVGRNKQSFNAINVKH